MLQFFKLLLTYAPTAVKLLQVLLNELRKENPDITPAEVVKAVESRKRGICREAAAAIPRTNDGGGPPGLTPVSGS